MEKSHGNPWDTIWEAVAPCFPLYLALEGPLLTTTDLFCASLRKHSAGTDHVQAFSPTRNPAEVGFRASVCYPPLASRPCPPACRGTSKEDRHLPLGSGCFNLMQGISWGNLLATAMFCHISARDLQQGLPLLLTAFLALQVCRTRSVNN